MPLVARPDYPPASVAGPRLARLSASSRPFGLRERGCTEYRIYLIPPNAPGPEGHGVMSNDFAPNDAAADSTRKIRVVLVDDTAIGMAFLGHVLETCPRVQIIGHAHDGIEGFALATRLQP